MRRLTSVRQGFVRLVPVGEQRVAARARHFERIEHRGHGRPLLVALVGVEVHLAVRQGADRLAVLADVRDQHDGGVAAHELLGVDHGGRPEHFREADLILLAQLLIAQQDHEMLVPGVPDLGADVFIDVLAQIDADDFGAERRRQRSHRECRRTERGFGVGGSRFHPGRFHDVRLSGAGTALSFGAIMRRGRARAQGSLPSTRMKAIRQGSVPRLTQAWLVPCCTSTSPALR